VRSRAVACVCECFSDLAIVWRKREISSSSEAAVTKVVPIRRRTRSSREASEGVKYGMGFETKMSLGCWCDALHFSM